MDVDIFQDIRIRKLIKRQGGKAVTVYALLLCIIYKDGYYMRWDEELPFIISEQTGFEEAYIREAVKCCISLGLFNEELYASEGILTSKGIQERYKIIRKSMKRVVYMDEYLLIPSEEKAKTSEEKGKTSEDLPKTSEEKGKTSEDWPIKEKESKEKKKKRVKKDAASAAALLEARKESFYNSLIPFVARYGREMVREFFEYWTEPNKSKTRMRFELERTWDLARRLVTWASREKDFRHRNNGTDNLRGNSESRAQDAASIVASLAAEE